MIPKATAVAFLQLAGLAVALPAEQQPLRSTCVNNVLEVRAEYVPDLL
jgi:hypothetical protein